MSGREVVRGIRCRAEVRIGLSKLTVEMNDAHLIGTYLTVPYLEAGRKGPLRDSLPDGETLNVSKSARSARQVSGGSCTCRR